MNHRWLGNALNISLTDSTEFHSVLINESRKNKEKLYHNGIAFKINENSTKSYIQQ